MLMMLWNTSHRKPNSLEVTKQLMTFKNRKRIMFILSSIINI